MTEPVSYITINDLTVAYRSVGESSASPLVFLHGLGDSSIITFDRIARHPALRDTPALLIDLPGFGHSTAPATWPATIEDQAQVVAMVLDALNISTAPVSGHSMGGSIALMLATIRPDLVSHLILAEPLLRPEQSELARIIIRRTEEDFVTRGVGMLQLATRRKASRGERASIGFLTPLDHANPTMMHRSSVSLLANRSHIFLEMLEGATMPCDLIAGERTSIAAGLVPENIPIHRIPYAGHAMMHENPDAYAQTIAGILCLTGRDGVSR
jgi:pimeloyl-ACP methyl ester carboxylesterase